jgi:hypothetical protein
MTRELEVVLNALVPDHIKENNPVVSELFRIFLEFINETSYAKVSNLSNLVTAIQEDEAEDKSSFSYYPVNKRENIELKMAFVNLFTNNLKDFYEVMKNDKEIDSKLEQYARLLGLEKSALYDLTKLNVNIDEEVISCSKNLAQTKGTNIPFDFLCNLIENEQLDPGIAPIGDIKVFDHKNPDTGEAEVLKYEVESSLHNVVFNKAIKPLVHPVGFEVIYTRVLKLLISDYFNLNVENYGYNVVVKQQNGRTYKWTDVLDASGNVTNQSIKTFSSNMNEYGIEELDIRFMSGERLYRIANGDLIYYDVNGTPHKWPKKYYDVEYAFRKRITVLTKDVKIDHHWSYWTDAYEVSHRNGTTVIEFVRDYTEKVDHIDDTKSLEDVKEYTEPILVTHNSIFRPEEFPEPTESKTLDMTKYIWMNNPKYIGVGPNVGTFKLGDPVKINEDEEQFWVDMDYYIKYYQKALDDVKDELLKNKDLLFTYSTRIGRRRIGRWLGGSDPRKKEDTRDVPNLTGAALRAKISSLKNDIFSNETDIKTIEDALSKVYSGREEFYFIVEGETLKDDYILSENIEKTDNHFLTDTGHITDELVSTTMLIDMSNADGMTLGLDALGSKPLGYEDSLDTEDGAGIFTYVKNQDGSFSLVDYLSFIGDALTLDSEIISDYKRMISEIDLDITDITMRINEIVGIWGVYERTKLRLERDEMIKTKQAIQTELNNILNKYN